MAKIKFKEIVAEAHGKVEGSSNVSYRKSYGCDHTYTWNKDNVVRLTPLRHVQQEAMRLANIAAKAIMADPVERAVWQKRFEEQTRYHYFRPFIVAMKMQAYKSAQLEG